MFIDDWRKVDWSKDVVEFHTPKIYALGMKEEWWAIDNRSLIERMKNGDVAQQEEKWFSYRDHIRKIEDQAFQYLNGISWEEYKRRNK